MTDRNWQKIWLEISDKFAWRSGKGHSGKVACSLLMCLFLPFNVNANAASFDCKKAELAVEKAICADPVLSELDDKIAKAHKEALGKLTPFWKEWYKEQQRKWLRDRNKTEKLQLVSLHRQRLEEITSILNQLPRHVWQVLELPESYDPFTVGISEGKDYIGVSTNERKSHKLIVRYIDVETGVEIENINTSTRADFGLSRIQVKEGFIVPEYRPSNHICWRDLSDTGVIVDNGDRTPAPATIPKMQRDWQKIVMNSQEVPFTLNLRTYYLVYLPEGHNLQEQPDCPEVSVMPFGMITPIKQGAIIETWDGRVFLKITDLRTIRRGFIAPQVFALDEYDYERYKATIAKQCRNITDPNNADYGIVYDECRAQIIREIIGKER